MSVLEPTGAEVRWVYKVFGWCVIIGFLIGGWAVVEKVDQGNAAVQVVLDQADQIKKLNEQIETLHRQGDAAEWRAKVDAARSQRENHDLREGLVAMLRTLRANGIDVPSNVFLPRRSSGTSANRPKVPSPGTSTNPGSPTPTGSPTPSLGPLLPAGDEVCRIVPALCPFLINPLSRPLEE
jgi:hypothetical protein